MAAFNEKEIFSILSFPVSNDTKELLSGPLLENSPKIIIDKRATFKSDWAGNSDIRIAIAYTKGNNTSKEMEDTYTVVNSFGENKDLLFVGVYDGHSIHKNRTRPGVTRTRPSAMNTNTPSRATKKLFSEISMEFGANGAPIFCSGRDVSILSAAYLHEIYLQQFSTAKTNKQVWTETYEEMDNLVVQKAFDVNGNSGGSTACTIVYDNNTKQLKIANAGDTRAVAFKSAAKKGFKVLTTDHIRSEKKEKARFISHTKDLSRGFGRFENRKKQLNFWSIPKTKITPSEYEYVVIASDGVWDVMTNEDIQRIIYGYEDHFMKTVEAQLEEEKKDRDMTQIRKSATIDLNTLPETRLEEIAYAILLYVTKLGRRDPPFEGPGPGNPTSPDNLTIVIMQFNNNSLLLSKCEICSEMLLDPNNFNSSSKLSVRCENCFHI